MRWVDPRKASLVAAFSVGLIPACSTAPRIRVLDRATPRATLEIVAVAPVEIRYEGEVFERELRTEELSNELWSSSGWLILAPAEFSVFDPRLNDPLRQTDVALQISKLGLPARGFGALRTIISLREAEGGATVLGRGTRSSGASYEGEVVVRISLVGPDGTPIASVEVIQSIDPFADRPDENLRPEITEALASAVHVLVDQCEGSVREGSTEGREVRLRPTPALLLGSVETSTLPHSSSAIAREADREILAWRLLRQLEPGISLDEAQRLAKLPPTVCVLGDRAPEPLLPGDCVLASGRDRILSPHALRRLRTIRKPPIELTVLGRTGERRIVWLR